MKEQVTPTVRRIFDLIEGLKLELIEFEEKGYSANYAGDEYKELKADLRQQEYALKVIYNVLSELG